MVSEGTSESDSDELPNTMNMVLSIEDAAPSLQKVNVCRHGKRGNFSRAH